MRTHLLPLLLLGAPAFGQPFSNCPTEAYLYQSSTVVYGVDLVTGAYNVLSSDLGIPNNVNGVGFNETDRYIYGFSKEFKDVVKMGQDYQATRLNVTGLPAGIHFYVGDVANNHYWIYHKRHGLYSINLDSSAPNFAQAEKKVGADTSMNLTDFAFHPGDGELYAVDNTNGNLYQIDTGDGSRQIVGNAGVTGTFGAGYFEKSGYYYISRNQDGHIFRLDLRNPDQLNPNAEFFAYGPASNQNDGARCASAPIQSSTVDWGDAPQSYGTRQEDNGARHGINDSGPRLGALIDADYDGFSTPWTDDSDGLDDEDGIALVTDLKQGQTGLIRVDVQRAPGYLQLFVDWNQDGDFDDGGEQVYQDQWLEIGATALAVNVPNSANGGLTYMRVRLSSQAGLGSGGGAADGEVEDYRVAISSVDTTYRHYPSESSFATVAFEDRWPMRADYDMNDVVMNLRFTETIREGKIEGLAVTGQLKAIGASLKNGFGIQLPGIFRGQVNSESISFSVNGESRSSDGILESGQTQAVLIVSEDLKSELSMSCPFYRTVRGCSDDGVFNFELALDFASPIDPGAMPSAPFDPFIFATPGYARAGFGSVPGRGLEIHLPGYPPTDKANLSYFGQHDDTSSAASNRYYLNSNGLPWALEFSSSWHYPAEYQDLLKTYPKFEDFIRFDGGQFTDWFYIQNANSDKLYQ